MKQIMRESFVNKPEEIGPQLLTVKHLQASFRESEATSWIDCGWFSCREVC
jgi:hypothetical protein